MKKILFLFAVLLTAVRASAYDFEMYGIYYNVLSNEDLTCEVTSGDSKYTGNVVIPASVTYSGRTFSVTTIGREAFYSCTSLTSVVIGNSVTEIGSYAFSGCSSLTSVEIPNSVTTIGRGAFGGCSSLTSVVIPNSVTEIGSYAFSDCYGLTSVVIGNSVTTIGRGAFSNCSSLTSVVIPNSVTEIGNEAFRDCSGLTSVKIPNSVTEIGEGAFGNCSSLTSVEIPNSVTNIGEGAFCACNRLKSFTGKFASDDHRYLILDGVLNSFAPAGLTNYTIPNSVTTIGRGAFSRCSGLTSVVIPNSVTEIGDYAFYGCSSLKEIISLNTTPPTASSSTFEEVSKTDCILKVPAEAVGDYKAAYGWKEFNDILPLTDEELGLLVGVESVRAEGMTDARLGRDNADW